LHLYLLYKSKRSLFTRLVPLDHDYATDIVSKDGTLTALQGRDNLSPATAKSKILVIFFHSNGFMVRASFSW
jgi:hypothetical protein